MNTLLKNIFKTQIQSLYGFEFQNFITQLYFHKYGEDNFVPPRKESDKGSDGIIISENRVVACYAPKTYKFKAFFKKAKDDYNSYKENLEDQYKNWSFVSNLEVPQQAITEIHKGLNSEIIILGIDNILFTIDELSGSKKRQIGKYLNVDSEYFTQDYLCEIIEDLLSGSTDLDFKIPYTQAVYTPDKIEINYDHDDVEEVLNEYGLFFEDGVFNKIESILNGYDDSEQSRIKNKIIYDYSNNTSGEFKVRLKILTEFYLGNYSSGKDDNYLFFIRAILLYFFEQCLIGKRTKGEK